MAEHKFSLKELQLGIYSDERLRETANRIVSDLPVAASHSGGTPTNLGKVQALHEYRMQAMLDIDEVMQHPELEGAHRGTRAAVVAYMLEMIQNDWQHDYAEKPLTDSLIKRINQTRREWPELDMVIALNKALHEPIHSDEGPYDFVEAYDFRCEEAMNVLAEMEAEEGIYPLHGAMRSQASRILNEIIEARTDELSELMEDDFIGLAKTVLIGAVTFDGDPEAFYEQYSLDSDIMTLMVESMQDEARREPVDYEKETQKAQMAEQLHEAALNALGEMVVTVEADVVSEFEPKGDTMQLPITHIPALKPLVDHFSQEVTNLVTEEWFMELSPTTQFALIDFYTGLFVDEIDYSLDGMTVDAELVDEINNSTFGFRHLNFYRQLYTALFEPYPIEVDLSDEKQISARDELVMRFDDALKLVCEKGYDQEQAVELYPPFSDELRARTAEILNELALASAHELDGFSEASIAHLGLEVLNQAIDFSDKMAVAEAQEPPLKLSVETFYDAYSFNSTFMQKLIKERRERVSDTLATEDDETPSEKPRAFDATLSTPETALGDYINQYAIKLIRTDYTITRPGVGTLDVDLYKELKPFEYEVTQSLKSAIQRHELTIDDLDYIKSALSVIAAIFPCMIGRHTGTLPAQKEGGPALQKEKLFEDLNGLLLGSPSVFDQFIDAALAIEYPAFAPIDVTKADGYHVSDHHAKRSRVFAIAKAFDQHGKVLFEQLTKHQTFGHNDFNDRVSAIYDIANKLAHARFTDPSGRPYPESAKTGIMLNATALALRPDLTADQVREAFAPATVHEMVATYEPETPSSHVEDISRLTSSRNMPSRMVH